MLERLNYLRKRLATGIWIIPITLCVVSFLLGVLMLGLDRHMTTLFSGARLFALPVDSARQVLSVIAGSVISVGGVSFSVTMVALTLTSGQYGPKVLRHFLEDNDSKISLGLFLGAYVYSLVVLTGYVETDRPHLTVLTGLLYALIAVMGFIRFIHRTATDLQADEIVERIGKRLEAALQQPVDDPGEKNARTTYCAGVTRPVDTNRPWLRSPPEAMCRPSTMPDWSIGASKTTVACRFVFARETS